MTSIILKENISTPNYPLPLRIAAKIISYIFHPLFVPVYVGLFFIYELNLFADISDWDKKRILIMFVIYYTFLPLAVTLLLKALDFISSVYLKKQRDRIIPYIICEIFYFWGWYVFKNLHYPKLLVMFGLAVFLACSAGLILNTYMKVSMHAMSVGVLSAILTLSALQTDMNFGFYISIGFLVAGLTATSRLIDSDHTQKEIYFGFFTGVLAQVVASFFV